jgi:hypothetical protein
LPPAVIENQRLRIDCLRKLAEFAVAVMIDVPQVPEDADLVEEAVRPVEAEITEQAGEYQ